LTVQTAALDDGAPFSFFIDDGIMHPQKLAGFSPNSLFFVLRQTSETIADKRTLENNTLTLIQLFGHQTAVSTSYHEDAR